MNRWRQRVVLVGSTFLVLLGCGCDKRTESATPSPSTTPSRVRSTASSNREDQKYGEIIRMLTQQQNALKADLSQAQQTIEQLQARLTEVEKERDHALSEFKLTLDAVEQWKKQSSTQNESLQATNQQLRAIIQQFNTELNSLYNQLGTTRVVDPNVSTYIQ